jgi:inosine/xanthosine triphosphatase
MIVAIGTKNPAKVHAVQDTLIRERLTFVSVKVDSGVADQPFSDEETLQGALNRAKGALTIANASLAFGLEGGVQETPQGLMLCNWGALIHGDGGEWIAGGAKVPLPEMIVKRLYAGEELATIMADVTGQANVRKKEGAMGVYTAGWVSRKELFSHLVKLLYGQYIASRGEIQH